MGREEWQERAGWLLAAVLLGVIVFGYLMPATGYFTAVPGGFGVPRHNSVLLEHLYRLGTGYDAGLWNPDFYFPFQGVLAFSDNHLGSGATYVLARLLGLSREHAFDVWFVVGTLLNFASALYVLRRLGLTTAGAALGACFFSFAVPVPVQDNHAQLVHRFASPLAALALWQMFERRRLVDLARLVCFTVWQFYCSIYLGLFLVYLLAALTLAILIVRRPFEWPQWRANLAAERLPVKLKAGGALLVSALAFAYLVGNYLVISRAYHLEHWRPVDVITRMLPRLESYLIADTSPLLDWLGRGFSVPDRWEHQLFIGFGAVGLILTAAVAEWRGRAAVPGLASIMLIALALLVLGTLWIGYFSLYHLIAWLPGINAIRSVSRIILIMLVPLSVLVALGADAVWRRPRRSSLAAVAVLAGLAALVVAEPLSVHKYSAPIAQWQGRLAALKARLPPVMRKDAILLVRTGSTDVFEQIHSEIDAMLLGQDLGYPVLNGYSAFAPPGYWLHPCASAKERLQGYSVFMAARTRIPDYSQRLVVLDLGAKCPADKR
jgi:hypothetical protein